jgi:3-hydroxyacyl-CoA dehydrogenase / 3-hydroxy-2-methylbutyryl-CoA dehydrogenase
MKIAGAGAVITGGASGIGRAIAQVLAQKGARVAIFDLNEAAGQDMAKDFGAAGALFQRVNVAEESSIVSAIEKTMGEFGAIHICVNCAGIGSAHKTFGKDGPFPLAAWNKTIGVNLTGTFNVARLCAEQMAKNQPLDTNGLRGVIVNIASVAAYDGQIGQVAYSASKAGVVGMTLPMARDLAGIGIRVNTIAPGLIETPLLGSLPMEVLDALAKSVLYPKRLGKPEEIAQLALAIVENDYINGECIRVDGGIRMQPR